jgi:hypothetical protein
MIELLTTNTYLSIFIIYLFIGFLSANVFILFTLLEFYSGKEKVDSLEESILCLFYLFYIVAFPYMFIILLIDVIKARKRNKKTYL